MKRILALLLFSTLGLIDARADFFSSNATTLRSQRICAPLTHTDGYVLTWSDSLGCMNFAANAPGSGASTALSNLGSVSINSVLLFQTGIDIGSAAAPPRNIFLYGSGTFSSTSIKLTGTPTANRVVIFPDANITVARSDAAQTFTGVQTFVAPILGTPTSVLLTNATGLPEGGLSTTDITTANATTSKHGFLLKLDNNAAHYMNGQGAWTTPAGGGGGSMSVTLDGAGGGTQSQLDILSGFGGTWTVTDTGTKITAQYVVDINSVAALGSTEAITGLWSYANGLILTPGSCYTTNGKMAFDTTLKLPCWGNGSGTDYALKQVMTTARDLIVGGASGVPTRLAGGSAQFLYDSGSAVSWRTPLFTDLTSTAANVYGLWSGTCSSSTFLRGDGACASASGGGAATSVVDSSALNILTAVHTASAVNYFAITNAATGAGPLLAAIGTDTDIDFNISSKGAGVINLKRPANGSDYLTVIGRQIQSQNGDATLSWDGGSITMGVSSGNVNHTGTMTSTGNPPVVSGCSATIGSGAKADAGFVTTTTTGACAVTLTAAAGSGATGMSCAMSNKTTANLMRQTGYTTNSATFTGTTVSGDNLIYSGCTFF